jgi:hypothetical protein
MTDDSNLLLLLQTLAIASAAYSTGRTYRYRYAASLQASKLLFNLKAAISRAPNWIDHSD